MQKTPPNGTLALTTTAAAVTAVQQGAAATEAAKQGLALHTAEHRAALHDQGVLRTAEQAASDAAAMAVKGAAVAKALEGRETLESLKAQGLSQHTVTCSGHCSSDSFCRQRLYHVHAKYCFDKRACASHWRAVWRTLRTDVPSLHSQPSLHLQV
jgi:hypothetical protein